MCVVLRSLRNHNLVRIMAVCHVPSLVADGPLLVAVKAITHLSRIIRSIYPAYLHSKVLRGIDVYYPNDFKQNHECIFLVEYIPVVMH